jgi:hypothetical protein
MDNYVVLLCFGDLKTYEFHYRVGLLQGQGKLRTTKGKKLVKAFDAETVDSLA